MTLLSICQQICREVGQPAPTSIVSNSSETARRLLAVMQTQGRVLASGKIELEGRFLKNHNWSALRKEFSFNTVDGSASYVISSSIGSDFNRFIDDTIWDRTNNWKVRVYSPVDWHLSKGWSIVSAQARVSMLRRGNSVVFDPTPAGAYSIYGEYLSKNWCESSGGTDQSAWAADTDLPLLDEDLMILGGKWRYLSRLGESYAEEKAEYEQAVFAAANADNYTSASNVSNSKALFVDNIPNRVS